LRGKAARAAVAAAEVREVDVEWVEPRVDKIGPEDKDLLVVR
jgi:hypothetical protein